ncbi:MAG: biotin-dependent carboxyltransferase family protein [Chitinophagaceae bacterium]|nr:biotin-dependent carboxyltransferase family protein [Chitinophagaceae bacterium]
MSIRVIKKGILDTIQDGGRFGYQHLGIHPSGAMDTVAMRMANAFTGNNSYEPVLEIHFPAPVLLFEHDTWIAISGADFDARCNRDHFLPINRCIAIKAGTVLSFQQRIYGARAYIAIRGGFHIPFWLNSAATPIGFTSVGTVLQHDMILPFKHKTVEVKENKIFPWTVSTPIHDQNAVIRYTAGYEIDRLNSRMQELLHLHSFTIDKSSNRMGYRLQGPSLIPESNTEILSTAVTRGTIQLLPNGQLIILMADHQTTGGYPRIGHIIAADFPQLAQRNAGESFQLKQVSLQEAHKALQEQELHLKQLETGCKLRMGDV